jgi:hypothetical protein
MPFKVPILFLLLQERSFISFQKGFEFKPTPKAQGVDGQDQSTVNAKTQIQSMRKK